MAMPSDPLVQLRAEIKRSLLAEVDAAYRESIQSLVPSSAPIMGIRVPIIRDKVKQFAATHSGLSLTQTFDLLDMAFKDQVREEILFCIFLLLRFKRQFKPELWLKIDLWIEEIENWEVCDQLATQVAGHLLGKHMELFEDLLLWSRAPNFWRRRFAVATACSLNQKGRHFPEETLKICAEVMNDEEIMVQKAIGWAIREASKKSPDMIYDFLDSWKGKITKPLMKQCSQKLSAPKKAALLH